MSDLASPPVDLPSPEATDALAFAPSGTRLPAAGRAGLVHVWDLEPGRREARLHKPLHRRGAKGRAVAFAQGGKLLKVSLLDLVSRQVQHSFDVPPYPGRVAFSPSGEAVAVACNEKGAKVWDVASGREILTLKGQGDVVGTVAFSPRGDLVATETSGNPLACGNGPRGNCVPHAAGTREGVNA